MIGDRWGVTDDDVARRYPCDDHLTDPSWAAWRGVTVQAPPAAVWPWLVQVRLAPYSYDWIDNRGRRSPQELRALPDPVPDEPFTASGGRPAGRVLAAEREAHVTVTIMGAVMSYVLVPAAPTGPTRLLMKLVGEHNRLVAPLLCVGDLVMARRQLLNLKRLAER